jgi:hypothetical protein
MINNAGPGQATIPPVALAPRGPALGVTMLTALIRHHEQTRIQLNPEQL